MAKKKTNKFFLSISAVIVAITGWLTTNIGNGQGISFSQNLCLSEFYQGIAPEIVNDSLNQNTYALCYNGFTLNYSGISKTPIWVAEKLSPQRLATKIPREDSFHEEERLPLAARALLSDYRSSGYDRGHMAPNADMNNKQSQHDSFCLANMIPQTPENNQNTWREIEEATRAMVNKYKLETYVVTGPAFLNKTVKYSKKGSKVFVPSHVYKVIYMPQVGIASAYFAPNDKSKTAKVISICELEEKTGISFFPSLDENTKRQVFELPLKANSVKANKQPNYLRTDSMSQCAPMIDPTQTEITKKKFVVGYDYVNGQSSGVGQSVTDLGQDVDVNQIILKLIQLFKEMEK